MDGSVGIPLAAFCGTVIGDLRAGVVGPEFLEMVLDAFDVNLDDLVRVSLAERSNEVATGDWSLDERFEAGNCEKPSWCSFVVSSAATFSDGMPSAATWRVFAETSTFSASAFVPLTDAMSLL